MSTENRWVKDDSPRLAKRQAGIAIVTVITIMAVLAILVVTLSFVAISENRSTRSSATYNTTVQLADAVSERARLVLVNSLKNSRHNAVRFLERLASNQPIMMKDGTTLQLTGVTHSVTVDGVTGKWKLGKISAVGNGWVDIRATVETTAGAQTVMRRVSFGKGSDVFNLAMLTETVNCMFCHLRVNGDIGTLQHFRPGWGREGVDGQGSGGASGGSVVTGNVFAARTVSADDTALTGTNRKVNGAKVTGTIETNSKSTSLPKDEDGDGIADFPPIIREQVEASAGGSVSVSTTATDGARMILVSPNSALTSIPTRGTQAAINGTYNGSVILIGTKENPINLSEDMYVTGDVIIKGVVTGRGAIYAGRNLYFAGDVVAKYPPDKPNQGVCAGVTDVNQCARLNVQAGKDEFRAAARNNMVIGDYTERDIANNDMPWYRRQSADFYKQQFGFYGGQRFYERGTGDELDRTCDAQGNNCIFQNIERAVIAANRVQASPNGQDYTYSFRPGFMNESGAFTNWLSDGLYQQLLGTETMDYGVWRWNAPDDQNGNGTVTNTEKTNVRNQVATQILSNLQGYLTATGRSISTDSNFNLPTAASKCNKCTRTIKDNQGTEIAKVYWDGGSTMRMITLVNTTYETQINRLDAYMYANQRIAGKVFSQATAVNGGMVAQEIGILAPGRIGAWPWESYNNAIRTSCLTQTGAYFVPDTNDCAFTINYDYRLRNGGYGYNQIGGQTGQTIGWSVAENEEDKVR
jgi:Tfp pilus assembly protein PilX